MNSSGNTYTNIQHSFVLSTSGTASTVRFGVTGAADTALTLSTEAPSTYFNLGQIRTHAAGSISLQRDFRITGSTHAFSTTASTIGTDATFAVDGPAIAGTNALITNGIGIYVGGASLNASTTNAYGLYVNVSTGAKNNYAAYFNGSVGIGSSSPTAALTINSLLGSGNGGNATNALAIYGGQGGNSIGANAGFGGNSIIQGGLGGTVLTGSGWTGGAGGNLELYGGSGGGAVSGSTNGNGGSIYISGGLVGSGGTGGSTGNVVLATTKDGTTIGNVGIGTTTPTAQLTTTGTVQFAGFGAGTVQTDAQGNITVSSDERLKNINGTFDRGLDDLEKLDPILYHWNATSGLDQTTQYAGFSAQNVQGAIPEAVDTDPRGYLSLQDRPILATAVNAIKELAGRTDTLSLSTTTLSMRLTAVEGALGAATSSEAMPHALTATQVTADSLSIANGVSAGTLTAQSVNADGTVSAARYVVPATAQTFTDGSTTMSADLPDDVLTGDGNADLYKVATYGVASVQALSHRTDLLSLRIDDIESRLSALETSSSTLTTATSGALALASSTVKDALSSLGIIIKQGFLALDTLVTHQLVFKTGDDGTSSTGSVTIPAGQTEFVVDNALVLPTSKIFLTFTSSVDGSWYLTDKTEGHFTIKLAKAQSEDTSFDYFLLQTEEAANPQVAGADGAQQPDQNQSTPPAPTQDDGGPVVTLNGDAAIALAEGATWTDPGATASDPTDGDLTSSIAVDGGVDTDTAGIYTITYRVTDAAGKVGEVSRIVTVSAPSFGGGSDTGGSSGDTGSGAGDSTSSSDGSSATDTGSADAPSGDADAGDSSGSAGSSDAGTSSSDSGASDGGSAAPAGS